MKYFRCLQRFPIFIVDYLLALTLVPVFILILVLLSVLCLKHNCSPLFLQRRIGKDSRPFVLFKFRSMSPNAPNVPTHQCPKDSLLPFGVFIRHYKIDELPQILNVLNGTMSFVGPRPHLPIQSELHELRSSYSILTVLPGITGLSQVSRIDMSNSQLLIATDSQQLSKSNDLLFYLRILWLTLVGSGSSDPLDRQ